MEKNLTIRNSTAETHEEVTWQNALQGPVAGADLRYPGFKRG